MLKRRKAAASLGVRFKRSASFRLPNAIWLGGQMQRLSLPDENGVKVAFIELLLDDCYGCRRLLKRGEGVKTVLDIGANVGLFGIAARNSFPDARIHLYEPNRQLESYLAVQAEAAELEFFIEAVGAEPGMISLEICEDSVQTRTRRDDEGRIPQISFREAIERLGGEIGLLKIDCEGAEWDIFRDIESWQHVKNVSMEYHLFEEWQTEERVKEVLKYLGFTITSFNPVHNFGLLSASRKG